MVWFGVLMVVALEMALISPPVGMNVFVVKGLAEHLTLGTIYRGVGPFWLAMVVLVVLLMAVPDLALFLPG